jgi:hypothetical protein
VVGTCTSARWPQFAQYRPPRIASQFLQRTAAGALATASASISDDVAETPAVPEPFSGASIVMTGVVLFSEGVIRRLAEGATL